MCTTCGCNLRPSKAATPAVASAATAPSAHVTKSVHTNLLAANDRVAAHNRGHLEQHGVCCINLMSSPGAGKTRLLEATIDALEGRYRLGVIEGDLETENDAARIRAHGVPAVQITTGTACHLDAAMIHGVLHSLELDALDVLFVENVGNLVCPASFDLGQRLNVVLLSVPEGDDKPAKYPVMFRRADLVLVTKTDLLPLMPEFELARVRGAVRALGSAAPVLEVSARTGTGMERWLRWLADRAEHGRGEPAKHVRHAEPAALENHEHVDG